MCGHGPFFLWPLAGREKPAVDDVEAVIGQLSPLGLGLAAILVPFAFGRSALCKLELHTGTKSRERRYRGRPAPRAETRRGNVMLGTILLIVLVLLLIGALPSWGHSRNWGYGPSGGLGLVVLILLILVLMGRI